MRTVLTVIGMIALAHWVFIGLLHGFLHVQEKNSPETYARLHRMPVIGGYFPTVDLPSEADVEQERLDELRLRLVDARTDFQLPPAFSAEEYADFTAELQRTRDELEEQRVALEARERDVKELVAELVLREDAVRKSQSAVAEEATRIELARRELEAGQLAMDGVAKERDDYHLGQRARIIAQTKPEKAKELLVGSIESVPQPEERDRLYRDAARVLALLDPEASGAILERLSQVEYVRVMEAWKTLPVPETARAGR